MIEGTPAVIAIGVLGYVAVGWLVAIVSWRFGWTDSPRRPLLSWPVVVLVAAIGIAMMPAGK